LPEIVELFKLRANNIRTANDFNCKAIFQSVFAEKNGAVNSSEIYEWLKRNVDNQQVRRIIETTKFVCPPGMVWHYHKDRPPESFGYDEVFHEVSKLEEPSDSPFFGALTHRFCQRATV
jgi:hypothetical protein